MRLIRLSFESLACLLYGEPLLWPFFHRTSEIYHDIGLRTFAQFAIRHRINACLEVHLDFCSSHHLGIPGLSFQLFPSAANDQQRHSVTRFDFPRRAVAVRGIGNAQTFKRIDREIGATG